PIAIPTFELVAEEDLFRSDEAERRVVDLEIAYPWRQAHIPTSGSRSVRSVVGGDLLDVYWRRKFVEGKMARIDDADAIEECEPQLSIGGLRDQGDVAASTVTNPYAV